MSRKPCSAALRFAANLVELAVAFMGVGLEDPAVVSQVSLRMLEKYHIYVDRTAGAN
jgi:hypothetical protein